MKNTYWDEELAVDLCQAIQKAIERFITNRERLYKVYQNYLLFTETTPEYIV